MKKGILTLIIVITASVTFAQTSKAIITSGKLSSGNGSNAFIVDFDPTTAVLSNYKSVIDVESVPRDIIYDAKNGHIIYQDKFNGLVFSTLTGGNSIASKNFTMMNTVMAPAYMPATEKIVCFNVQKDFNGYGSNEENLFLTTIDVKKGTNSKLIKFSDLSFDNVVAPFYGKVNIIDRFTQKEIQKDVAISKAIYISEKDLYMVMIKDVTGTNRLYKIKIISSNAAISSARCEYNIIDMAYILGTNNVKTLFFVNEGSKDILKVGDLNITTNVMSNVVEISTITGGEINNGSIKFNNDQSKLFVSKYDSDLTTIKSLNVINNQINSVSTYSGYIQFDFGFNESAYKSQSKLDILGLYPNPSSGIVYFKNNTGVLPTSLKVYDHIGQLVRSIKIEELANNIEIDLRNMATGIYTVRVDMLGKDFIGKVVVSN